VSRRRVIVAFEELQSAASRVVGQFSSPTFADGDLRGPPAGRGRFWCAADLGCRCGHTGDRAAGMTTSHDHDRRPASMNLLDRTTTNPAAVRCDITISGGQR